MKSYWGIFFAAFILIACGDDSDSSTEAQATQEVEQVAEQASAEQAQRVIRPASEQINEPTKVSEDIAKRVRNKQWRLVMFNGAEPATGAWIEFDGRTNSLAGFLGCNQIRGKVFSEYDQLKITRLARTEDSCDAPEVEAEERQLFTALQAIDYSVFEEGDLTLTGDGQEMVFRAH